MAQRHRFIAIALAVSCLGAAVAAQNPPPAQDQPQDQPQDQNQDQDRNRAAEPEPAGPGGVSWEQTDPRRGLLTPLPEAGGVPPIVTLRETPTRSQIEINKLVRDYERRIRAIRHEHLGPIKVARTRAEGIAKIVAIDDPLAFMPMIEVLSREGDDVRLAMLDHFAESGAEGQAALTWVAIHDHDAAVRNEARHRLVKPAERPALVVLDAGLRSSDHDLANRAGLVAGTLNALEAIPLLIMTQAAPGGSTETGDLAWIAIEKQRAFIAGLIPIAGEDVAAFQPIPGIVTEGVILRVVDAVVIIYRTEIHRALVAMTSRDWGRPTNDLGYDMDRWWAWYNNEYVPYKNAQARAARLAEGE